MKIQELTVGNWYNSFKFNKPVMCELSDLSELYRRCEGAECDESIIGEMFEPLVLTEKILVNIGATKHESAPCNWYQLPDSYIEIQYFNDKSNGKSGWVLLDKEEEMKAMIYIHQLQDLYRSLERKELKIKQP